MRFTAATLALWATAALASPSARGLYLRSAEEVKDELLPISEMTFTGPVTVGGPDVTLQGDASAIHEQILALNPEYDAEDFSGPAERGLEARQSTTTCNFGTPVERYYSQCASAITSLLVLGTSYCSVAPATCARVACSNSCSMYLCNNQFSGVSVYCQDIAADMGIIVSRCGVDNGNGDTRARGQLSFTGHYTYLTQQAC
ncbi:hypothetical protein Cob_v011875 [Colletotrichum orbiculare MAFF 240422]|uniref:Uncharacterized protein n=1 Tax=Colletotrichum orbiculare (strain 104-T / ATCC 96160 / CBS 514.97 / LARS 414 / MAFF 240422) TaxID=1213857 RepID=N4V6Y8_COLOR|nr:hypothetical protein Cob_v011875 [Colletotrichum orbiculare MAFF 240422]